MLLCAANVLSADIVVIVNANNSVNAMERKEVVDLFMGRVTAFDNGLPAKTYDLPSGTPLRAGFYKSLAGKSEAQIDAYWATLIFAGRMLPPVMKPSADEIITAVANDRSAIAYVPEQNLPPTVKVIMELSSD